MNIKATFAAFLLAATVLGGAAFAADSAKPAAATQETAAEKTADKDLQKVSNDAVQAFANLRGARLAIFNADPKVAKELIGKAKAAIEKARTDDSVLMKAEADLKPPKGAPATQPAADGKQTVAWLPVDAQMTLGEDFTATPEKVAAVTEANKTLAKGDRKGAIEKLKLADVDVQFIMAILPLDQTVSGIDQAAQEIDAGKYYEANVTLKKVEDGLRFDVVDAVATPQGKAKTAAAPAADQAKPADKSK